MADNSAFQLKNMYSPEFLEEVAAAFAAACPAFDRAAFLQSVFDAGWPARELKQRVRHISQCLAQHLPAGYAPALEVVLLVAQKLINERGEQMSFLWMILPDFVEAHGVQSPEISLPALEQLTQLASAEFAIRPFLLHYPEQTYPQMHAWATHPSAMVRRLASEGFRPRLPWGAGVPALKKDPSPILPVLETLKQDPAETVRRSVANNLNDISKEHPDLVLGIARRWQGLGLDTDWIIKHACRGLLKKGHPEALALHGFDHQQQHCTVTNMRCDTSVQIGERLYFSFSVENNSAQTQKIRVEYAIDYQTLSGKISRKVFKISELEIAAGQTIRYDKNQRFQDFTTRKHFPGPHHLEILLNGIVMVGHTFDVIA